MTVIVFPGQGSQFIEMSKDFYTNYSKAKEIFTLIEDVTKIKIKEIIFQDSSKLLDQTQYTQLAIFCASMSIYNVLIQEIDINKLNISYMLGHSLGEYSALTAAGFLTIEDCALLLKNRGKLMQNAYLPNQSGMAAIIGINCNTVENLIKNNNLNVEIANDNSPMQIVISGKKEDIVSSERFFKLGGAKRYILLNVSAAFHSKLMCKAQIKMNDFINNVNFKQSSISIISNYSASNSNDISTLVDNLSNQMSNRVRWVESIKLLEKLEETKIIEIGPGKVLTGLIRRISDNFHINNIEFISDIKIIQNEL